MELAYQLGLDDLIGRALAEDIGQGDVTTAATVRVGQRARARIVVKAPQVVFCGGPIMEMVFARCAASPRVISLAAEGAVLEQGGLAAQVDGELAGLLIGERTALNFLQLMSGIATLTAQYVAAVAGTKARIVDTRKTHPGLRAIEKYAVATGGGSNHRYGLDSGILIKDNHIVAAGSVTAAIGMAKRAAPHTLKIEVECETLDQVREALACEAEVLMLDNMPLDRIRQACELIAGRAQIEVSGNVSLTTVRAIAELGVHLISVGELTHSVRAADLSMRIQAAPA